MQFVENIINRTETFCIICWKQNRNRKNRIETALKIKKKKKRTFAHCCFYIWFDCINIIIVNQILLLFRFNCDFCIFYRFNLYESFTDRDQESTTENTGSSCSSSASHRSDLINNCNVNNASNNVNDYKKRSPKWLNVFVFIFCNFW